MRGNRQLVIAALLAGCARAPVELGGDPVDPTVTHAFGELQLEPLQDDSSRCVAWTLHNDEPLYVSAVELANEGLFHHSNWFVVPEEAFAGPDGYWPCADRGYSELLAGANGTVLTAQSTQSYVEEQRLSSGAVIKIPPRWKVVAGLHVLNTAPRPDTTRLWMTLTLAHPRDVTAVVTQLGMEYHDLALPPLARSAFTTECRWGESFAAGYGEPLWFKVHYVLPHYHYLGDRFEVEVLGGNRDGETIYTLDGFNGEPNGRTFDPPIEVTDADGLGLTCGYDNWRDTEVTWGNGDGEMCVALVLGEAPATLAGTVIAGSESVGEVGGVEQFEGPCLAVVTPNNPLFSMPTQDEIDGPLYVPPGDDEVAGPAGPVCADTPDDAVAEAPATLDSVQESVFAASCTFSACHGQSAAAGLDLASGGLRERLLSHEVASNTDLPLVDPGNADGSWLYHLLSRCTPHDRDGDPVAHMPANAPILLDPGLVATVRDWIDAGAP